MKILAITRYWGEDLRIHNVLRFLSRRAETLEIKTSPDRIRYWINLAYTFSFDHDLWRERSKKNAYFYQVMSRSIGSRIRRATFPYDLILLFEGLYSPGQGEAESKPYVIYEDTTLAIAMRRWPLWVPDTMRTKRYLFLQSSLYRNAARILTATEWARKSFIEDYQIDPEKVITVGMGSNLPSAGDSTADPDPYRILFVGYEFKRKGGEILLEAFRRVREEVPQAELDIVGPSITVGQAGVRVLGRIADGQELKRLHQRSLVFVMPSFFDPGPIAVIDALMTRTATVLSDSCGFAEFIQDGRNGFVVPTGDANALADRLLLLLRHPSWAREVGEAGYELARSRLNWETVADRMTEVFRSL